MDQNQKMIDFLYFLTPEGNAVFHRENTKALVEMGHHQIEAQVMPNAPIIDAIREFADKAQVAISNGQEVSVNIKAGFVEDEPEQGFAKYRPDGSAVLTVFISAADSKPPNVSS